MGKKRGGFKKSKNNTHYTQEKKPEVWRDHKAVHQNAYFKSYYQTQLASYFVGREAEFEEFWEAMKIRLPVVFRLNPNQPNYTAFAEKILKQEWLKDKTITIEESQNQGEFEPQEDPKIQRIEWFPNHLAYTLNTNKQIFKKSKKLAALHEFVQKATDSGLVTRQELVSMLPPIFLNVQPDDMVLDMCAAPGSKTSQMLEMLYQEQRILSKGCVIANDVEYSRAQMLIHQVQRTGTAGMAVINHSGQFLPQLQHKRGQNEPKKPFLFNKILCDVPCSGDGATRKLPNKWSNWHTNDGMALHPLQLSILLKGINLLAEDGYLVYSTCSLNPIEDEAVVLELMRKVETGLEIVDIHHTYNFKGRAGLLNWAVLESTGRELTPVETGQNKKLFHEYKTFDESKVPKRVKASMFPESPQVMAHMGIHKTMRLLPHDLNSGGFYVALLKKQKGFKWKSTTVISTEQAQANEQEQNAEAQRIYNQAEGINAQQDNVKKPQEEGEEEDNAEVEQEVMETKLQTTQAKPTIIPRPKKVKELPKRCEQYLPIQQEDFTSIQNYYGLPDILKKLLFVKRNSTDHRKKVTLVSEGITRFLDADEQSKKIKLINMGCKIFEKGKQTFAGNECLYRLCQDSIHYLLPLMNKRKVRISLNLFKHLLTNNNLKHADIPTEEERKTIQEISQGAFVVYIEESLHGKNVVDALVAQNFKAYLNLMVSKEDLECLRIRYL